MQLLLSDKLWRKIRLKRPRYFISPTMSTPQMCLSSAKNMDMQLPSIRKLPNLPRNTGLAKTSMSYLTLAQQPCLPLRSVMLVKDKNMRTSIKKLSNVIIARSSAKKTQKLKGKKKDSSLGYSQSWASSRSIRLPRI